MYKRQIVGFPNETEQQFLETLKVVEKVNYENAYTFIYSPRKGTPAALMEDNVSREEKGERFNKLKAVSYTHLDVYKRQD